MRRWAVDLQYRRNMWNIRISARRVWTIWTYEIQIVHRIQWKHLRWHRNTAPRPTASPVHAHKSAWNDWVEKICCGSVIVRNRKSTNIWKSPYHSDRPNHLEKKLRENEPHHFCARERVALVYLMDCLQYLDWMDWKKLFAWFGNQAIGDRFLHTQKRNFWHFELKKKENKKQSLDVDRSPNTAFSLNSRNDIFILFTLTRAFSL